MSEPASAARLLADLVPQLGRLIARSVEATPSEPLSLRQYRMLERLLQRPHRTTELASNSDVSQPTASAAVASLEARGLVERVPDPLDRRATRIVLTDAGRAAYEVARGRILERLAVITAEMTPEDVAALRRLHPVLLAGMDRLRESVRAGRTTVEPTRG